uniref:extensin family protein n=1 Tax=Paenibacillus abyssi TaxID=1340531 RepID=UPI00366D95D8
MHRPAGTARQPPSRTSNRPLPTPQLRQCLSQLSANRAIFTDVADRFYGNGCATVGTVKLAALNTDNATVTVTNLGPVTCGVATPFAAWARYGVDGPAHQILGSRGRAHRDLRKLQLPQRRRTSRRSGHATANAIDVAAFVLGDGRRISVLDDWSNGTPAERRFLRVVHDSACKRFGTTWGRGTTRRTPTTSTWKRTAPTSAADHGPRMHAGKSGEPAARKERARHEM